MSQKVVSDNYRTLRGTTDIVESSPLLPVGIEARVGVGGTVRESGL